MTCADNSYMLTTISHVMDGHPSWYHYVKALKVNCHQYVLSAAGQ